MYSRELDGATHRFGVTGSLWHGVLVMFDRETGSYWTQIDGRAIRGANQGATLAHVPSVFTTFGSWVDAHPDTLVLDKADDERGQAASHYAEYFADPERLFFEHLGADIDTSVVRPKEIVFGVRNAGDAVAVPQATIERAGIVHLEVGGDAIVLLRDERTGEVRAVRSARELVRVAGYEPTVRVADAANGEVMRVDTLEPVRVDRAFWYAWARTVPDARVHGE